MDEVTTEVSVGYAVCVCIQNRLPVVYVFAKVTAFETFEMK
jgi:hypothetical protein